MTTTGKFKINKMTQDIKVTSLDRPFFWGGGVALLLHKMFNR